MKQITKQITIIFLVLIMSLNMALAQPTSDNVMELTFNVVNQDPFPAAAGDVVEVRIGVENTGGLTANDMIIELILEYPFQLVAGEEAIQEIGTLNGYQLGDNMKIIKYKIRVDKDALAGNFDLKVKSYEKGSSTSITKIITVDVDNKENAEVIYIDQVELIPGHITPLTFTINNVGSAPLRDLTFQWENEEDIILPVGSDNTKYINYINIGESTVLKFDVIASANADPDLYKLDLILTYSDPTTGEETKINTKAGIYVGGATDFDVAFSGLSGQDASFSVSNIGSVSASSVTIKIPDQNGWKVTGTDSVIIGNLNEGDYTIASFVLRQLSTGVAPTNSEPGTKTQAEDLTIKLDIVYTDSRGNRNTITKEVSMDASTFMVSSDGTSFVPGSKRGMIEEDESFWSKYNYWIIAIIVLVLIFVIRKKYYSKTTKLKRK